MKIGKFEPMAIFVGIVKSVKRRRRQSLMKKYKWFIAGIAALVLIVGVVLNATAKSAKSANSMGTECVEDGSCCEDENTCTCR
jgi:bacteriorhodopsin